MLYPMILISSHGVTFSGCVESYVHDRGGVLLIDMLAASGSYSIEFTHLFAMWYSVGSLM